MNIWEEISGFKAEDGQVAKGVSIFMSDFKSLYLTNYDKLLNVSNDLISVKFKNVSIEISGENLVLKKLGKDELFVCGDLKSVVKNEK